MFIKNAFSIAGTDVQKCAIASLITNDSINVDANDNESY